MTSVEAPYLVAYNARLRKHVVIEKLAGKVVAERDTREAADATARCLTEQWIRRPVGPCPCECNSGGFCGGCGHAGCGGVR